VLYYGIYANNHKKIMKSKTARAVFKDARGIKGLMKGKKRARIILLAKHPNARGVLEVHHTSLQDGESVLNAYRRLIEKDEICMEHILHSGFLNYSPEIKTTYHDGMSVFAGVSASTENHVNALHEALKKLGYEGRIKDITKRKTKK
jgi:hypothetical protein